MLEGMTEAEARKRQHWISFPSVPEVRFGAVRRPGGVEGVGSPAQRGDALMLKARAAWGSAERLH
jgi:hypothetical protein